MAIALNLASLDETSDAKKAVRGENFSFHSDDRRLQHQTLGSEALVAEPVSQTFFWVENWHLDKIPLHRARVTRNPKTLNFKTF